ncbi:MAG: sugar phosphate isomerase/epimerase [Melioribacteraceae bacterium]|nr:sugar phosphate isomerase/epimerase [Melioribacteraceae bacterium]MCF8264187.1 sugar phosphate isomerase/epimerase [Melioribacteraceae bacterium]
MIKVANAPCSWGILEFGLEGDAAKYPQFLDELKETGYIGTELGDWGFLPTNPEELKFEINKRNLKLLGAFVPVNFKDQDCHEAGEKVALKTAELMYKAGFTNAFIVLADDNGTDEIRTKYAGRIKPEHSLNIEQFKIFANGVNNIADSVLNKFGIRSVFHHHCGGFIETETEIDKLMEFTNPELVGLCFDSGHLRFGGSDPISILKKYQDRIWHVHFKDCDTQIVEDSRANEWDYFKSVENGVFCELGKGAVDFSSILDYLKNWGYDDWIVVEQDVLPGMGSPKVCARRNRDYLQVLGI